MSLNNLIKKSENIAGLSLQLAKANFKLKNEGSYLGVLWYLLEPLLLFIVLLGIRNFSDSQIPNYPLYLLLGLIMFNFFSKTTNSAVASISGNSGFIKSVKTNQEALVISSVLVNVFSHFFEIIAFALLMIFFKVNLIFLLIYPLVFVFFTLFVLGVSFILSAGGVYINDLSNVWRVLTSILFFSTPLFYLLQEGSLLYLFNLFNPLFHFISITRQMIIYNSLPGWHSFAAVAAAAVAIFAFGIFVFNKFKKKFAELV